MVRMDVAGPPRVGRLGPRTLARFAVPVIPPHESLSMNEIDRESLPPVLNLGCGRKHLPGAVNLDVTLDTSPDVVHDLNRRPWPFPDDSFREVVALDVIEHLDDVIGSMEEIHRVCRDGAVVRIT